MGWQDWFGGQNTKELPRELFNQDLSKLPSEFAGNPKFESGYLSTDNTIYYPNDKEYYLNPKSRGAALRAHEFEHWKQDSHGAIPQMLIDSAKEVKSMLRPKMTPIEAYHANPDEQSAAKRFQQY